MSHWRGLRQTDPELCEIFEEIDSLTHPGEDGSVTAIDEFNDEISRLRSLEDFYRDMRNTRKIFNMEPSRIEVEHIERNGMLWAGPSYINNMRKGGR